MCSGCCVTHLEEFDNPSKLEEKWKIPFSHVTLNLLSLFHGHVFVGTGIPCETILFLEAVDIFEAKITNQAEVHEQYSQCEEPVGMFVVGIGDSSLQHRKSIVAMLQDVAALNIRHSVGY